MLNRAHRRRWLPAIALVCLVLAVPPQANGSGGGVAPLVTLRTLASQGARQVSTVLRGAAMRGSLQSTNELLNAARLDQAAIDALLVVAVEGRLHELPALRTRPDMIPVIEQWARTLVVPLGEAPEVPHSARDRLAGCQESNGPCNLPTQLANIFATTSKSPQELFLNVRRNRIRAALLEANDSPDALSSIGIAVSDADVLTAEELIEGLHHLDVAALKARGIRPIAGLDLDETIMAGDAAQAFLEFLIAKNAFKPEARNAVARVLNKYHPDTDPTPTGAVECTENLGRCMRLERLSELSAAARFEVVGAAMAGMTPSFAESLALEFYTEGIPGRTSPWLDNLYAMGPNGRFSAKELIAKLRAGGVTVVPTTTNYDFMARAAARALDLNPRLVVASQMERALGRYTGAIERNLLVEGTLTAFAEDVGEAPLLFFGDSATGDAPLMRYAGQGFMVHPTREFLAVNETAGGGFRGLTFRIPSELEAGKTTAAAGAVDMLQAGDIVGVGVGSTTAEALRLLGAALTGPLKNVRVVPSRRQVGETATGNGVPLAGDETDVTVVIDGAEEVDANGFLIKGLGSALVREKELARQASAVGRFLVVVTPDKVVGRLGTTRPVPIEFDRRLVDDNARRGEYEALHRELKRLGGRPVQRGGNGGPFVTDAGNYVIDLYFDNGIRNPIELAGTLDEMPGVVEHGLFIDLTDRVFIGEGHVLATRTPPKDRIFAVRPGPGGLPQFENDGSVVLPAFVDFELLGKAGIEIRDGVRDLEIEKVTGFITVENDLTTFHITGVP